MLSSAVLFRYEPLLRTGHSGRYMCPSQADGFSVGSFFWEGETPAERYFSCTSSKVGVAQQAR